MGGAPVTALVLAAGAARRFGPPKQLAQLGGQPLVRRAARCALDSGAGSVLVVLGRAGGEVRRALHGLPLNCVVNPHFGAGLSTSLRAGLEALPPDHAALVFLGDQPDVPATAARAVVAAYRASDRPIVLPIYNGVPGHPVLFGPELRGELLAVRGDEGARAVVARDPARLERVHLPLDAPRDIDTVADVREWTRREAEDAG